MPISSPCRSTSAPPLLPGLIGALVWMRPVMEMRVPSTISLTCAIERADDAGCRRLRKPQRATQGKRIFPDLDLTGIAHSDWLQVTCADLQHGQILGWRLAHEASGHLPPIREQYGESRKAAYDVIVGHDVAARGQDLTRPNASRSAVDKSLDLHHRRGNCLDDVDRGLLDIVEPEGADEVADVLEAALIAPTPKTRPKSAATQAASQSGCTASLRPAGRGVAVACLSFRGVAGIAPAPGPVGICVPIELA